MPIQTKLPDLTREEIARYSRHVLLPEIGMVGQQKLKNASVLIVGLGGLGSPIALYLAAAGVGRIGLVDPDVVDASNLQRQVIHSTRTKGSLKVESAREAMLAINPLIDVVTYPVPLVSTNALEISESYDILVDGTDNIPSRYLLSDLAVLTRKPYVYGSIYRFEGQVSVFGLEGKPCYRCLFPEPPPPGSIPPCSTAGVMGVLPGTVGTIQATEVIKLITGSGEPLAGKLLLYDALQMSFDIVKIKPRVNCAACGDHPTVMDLIDYQMWCGEGPEYDPSLVGEGLDLEPRQLAEWIKKGEKFTLVDIREPFETNLSAIPGAILISVAELESKVDEFLHSGKLILFCRNGIRSAMVVKKLNRGGIYHLYGGINAWVDQVDRSQVKY
jgi:sulfur-carrier protein adenylyltransferase/sulfurtransferase